MKNSFTWSVNFFSKLNLDAENKLFSKKSICREGTYH